MPPAAAAAAVPCFLPRRRRRHASDCQSKGIPSARRHLSPSPRRHRAACSAFSPRFAFRGRGRDFLREAVALCRRCGLGDVPQRKRKLRAVELSGGKPDPGLVSRTPPKNNKKNDFEQVNGVK
jgi:hypothetical protein